MRHILTIAGSDSCAGAGVQADLKTISALGSYGLTVITAVTAQNTTGVQAVQEISPPIIEAQLKAIFSDIRVDAVKIGMLSGPEIIEVVSRFFASLHKGTSYAGRYTGLPVILDPVMVAKSGDRLLQLEAIEMMKTELFPLVRVLTPNIPEAEALLDMRVAGIEDMKKACGELLRMGPDWVVVKGGHLQEEPVDVAGSAEGIHLIGGKRVATNNNHGTGCTLSSAIAAFIGQGDDELRAIQKARAYIQLCLKHGFALGKGVGILDHFTGKLNLNS